MIVWSLQSVCGRGCAGCVAGHRREAIVARRSGTIPTRSAAQAVPRPTGACGGTAAVAVRLAEARNGEPAGAAALPAASRRSAVLGALAGAASLAAVAGPARALPGFQKDLTNKRRAKIPVEDYTEGPEGLKFYDVIVGTGDGPASEGQRVVVHYEAKHRGVTFMTSRQGAGVTGGTPLGFDVGAKRGGKTLEGLDLGVRGMKVGGRRKLLVPPNLAYGDRGIGEVPGNATLDIDVELLSIKKDSVGFRTKLVEG